MHDVNLSIEEPIHLPPGEPGPGKMTLTAELLLLLLEDESEVERILAARRSGMLQPASK